MILSEFQPCHSWVQRLNSLEVDAKNNDSEANMDIKLTDFQKGKSSARMELHFSGGIKGLVTNEWFALFPTSNNPAEDALLFKKGTECFSFAMNECNLSIIGTCVEYLDDSERPLLSVWRTGMPHKDGQFNAADLWTAISHQASLVKDDEYQKYSSYLSTRLRGVGLRLRDISNHYNYQLNKALQESVEPGTYYSNAALLDMYNDYHSLLSELSSARDHLSKIAAIHVNAPQEVDSLSSLKKWVTKAINSHHSGDPMIKILLKASGTRANPNWLWHLGDKRNEMLHRQPMGANKLFSALYIVGNRTQYGEIMTIKVGEPPRNHPNTNAQTDPLVFISELANNFEILCKRFALLAKYSSDPPRIEITK